jgi:diguanylate cyclase (GGDEF)-like protein
MRDGDMAARFGGDEFGIVLAPGTDRQGAEAVARRLQAKIREPIGYGGATLKVTASVGSAISPDDGRTLAELIAVADARMYRMKHRRLSA